MLDVLLPIQTEKVDELYRKWKAQDILSFQSPTGSGKTMMLAYLINKIHTNNKKAVFCVVPEIRSIKPKEQQYEPSAQQKV
jgi:superfamily II DNA or RNA helicase